MGKAFQNYLIILLIIAVSIGAFCIIYPLATAPEEASQSYTPQIAAPTTDTTTTEPTTEEPEPAPEVESTPTPVEPEVTEPLYDQAVLDIIAEMTVREKLYQLLYVSPEAITGVATATAAGNATKEALAEYPVGGIIYFANNVEDTDQITEMLENTQSYATYPLFLGTDEEGGTVSRLGSNSYVDVTRLDSMATYSDPDAVYDMGKTLGGEMSALGFNMNFAPVADVVTNPANTVIGDRSFSTDATEAATLVASMVAGLQDSGVSATLKHFPGHGSTETDTHDGVSYSDRTYEELVETEFLPFEAGIAAGTDFVMVGHQIMSNLPDGDVPACLSSYIVTDLLRNELGFTGVIITDAMNMAAITDDYDAGEAAVAAILAGVDMILLPDDLDEAYSGLFAAISSGTLTEERVNESVYRILKLKYDQGLFN